MLRNQWKLQIYNIIEDTRDGERMENAVTDQPTALKPSLVKTNEFELQKYWLTLTEMWLRRKTANIYVKNWKFYTRTMTQQKLQI